MADSAFVTDPEWIQFWARYSVEPIPLGKNTPWPNRAERVVQIMKKTITILFNSAQEDPDAKLFTISAIAKRAASARCENYMKEGRTHRTCFHVIWSMLVLLRF